MARIDLDNIAHAYGARPQSEADYALRRIHLTFEPGGAYALLGPSGCGKTTMLNLMSGLLVPTEGSILFDGVDVTERTSEQRNIAQVFQFPVVYDTMTVYENLAFPLRNRRVQEAAIDARVREIADMLGLASALNHKARRLTADAKQKISLGRGLVRADVSAMLFDEPLTVIDPQLKWQLRSQLKKLHRQVGTTMIYVTHDQTEALTFADTVIVMYDGRVVQVGTPEELFERPNHTFVGYFIGSPGMNVLPASIEGRTATVAGHPIWLPHSYERPASAARIELGVRPEFVRIALEGKGLPVRIHRVDDVGRFKIARVRLADHALNVMVGEDMRLSGDTAAIEFDHAHLHIYADGELVEGRA
jgi:glycerol transport system ATP-binding protein